ncbi:MAG: thermostable hemolysin [Flavobacteriaceae bacterium]
MPSTLLVGLDHPRRADAEAFIQDIYNAAYGATVNEFPSSLFVHFDDTWQIRAAAGLRTRQDGFFSEIYLDRPVEEIISTMAGPVERDRILEVTTLASRSPRLTPSFIRDIVAHGVDQQFSRAFFTLTRRFWSLVQHMGIASILLADADHRRVADFQLWGRYYAHQPSVYATRGPLFSPAPASKPAQVGHETLF